MDDIQTKTADPSVSEDSQVTADPADTPAEETADNTAESDDTEMTAVPEEGTEPTADDAQDTAKETPEDKDAAKAEADGSADANKMRIVAKALRNIERDINNVIRLLESGHSMSTKQVSQTAAAIGEAVGTMTEAAENGSAPTADMTSPSAPTYRTTPEGRIVEGVFDGQNMVGSDGKIYTVPANYASKSKLVEGDMLKLTITPRGSFIYKQIGPIERSRVMATLGFDPTIGEYYAADDTRRWNVLKASVTYYRGDVGDELVLLVPKAAPSKWAAVENIIKTNPLAAGGESTDNGYGGFRQPGEDGQPAGDSAPEAEKASLPPSADEAPAEEEAPAGEGIPPAAV